MDKIKDYEKKRSASNKAQADDNKAAVFNAEDNGTLHELIATADDREVGYLQVMSRLNKKQHAQLAAIANAQQQKLMRGRGKQLSHDVTAQQLIAQLIDEKYNEIK